MKVSVVTPNYNGGGKCTLNIGPKVQKIPAYLFYNTDYTKNIVKYYVIANVIQVSMVIASLLVLGINIASVSKYPEYMMLTQVKILDILERLQNIFSIQLFLNVIMIVAMCIMYSLKNIEKNIKKDSVIKIFCFVIPFITILIGMKIFPNITGANIFYSKYLPIILASFGLITIISIVIGIKCKKNIEKQMQV